MSSWKVTLRTPDGDEMVVHPESEATHGVYIAEDGVKGDIIDAPIKSEWDSTTMQEGGTQRGVDYEYRDIHLAFHVTDNAMSAEEADSMLAMKFDVEEDEWDPTQNRQTQMTLETDMSGERCLDLLIADTTEYGIKQDPIVQQYFDPTFHLRAGQPMWYEPQGVARDQYKVYAWEFGTGDSIGGVEIENRTNRAMRHSWVVTGGVGTKVYLPDVSWVGPKGNRLIAGPNASRMVQLPTIAEAHGGGFRVTLDRGKLMVRDFNNTNVLGQMPVPGSYFMYRIPPYTRKTTLPIQIESASEAGRIEFRAPQLWSRPYGLEMW